MSRLAARAVEVAPEETNRVVFRIWLAKKEGEVLSFSQLIKALASGTECSVGHASMELPHSTVDQLAYVSFWPERMVEHAFQMVTGLYIESAREDERREGLDPDLTVCLYSLNVPVMLREFEALRAKGVSYALAGDVSSPATRAQSCASYVWHVLKKGLPSNIKAGNARASSSLVVTPNELCDRLKSIKAQELETYPDTQHFAYAGEDLPEERKRCCIM